MGVAGNASTESAPSIPPSPRSGKSSSSSSSRHAADQLGEPPPLIICRNKHWRYISAFHGPWLQMPIEILETIANINYNTPRPRPIDPAVFFDLLKVRRLCDEATNLAVRAASDIASPVLTNVHGGYDTRHMGGFGTNGPGHGGKLSRERKFRMREQASQKLARAYRLDEIACSVATMQGSSPLDDIGSHVLQRNARDPDARYVHFFHEKIPSRQLAGSTSLQPLTEIMADRPTEPEAWRTRAAVRVFKEDYDGAVHDLTQALAVCRFHQTPRSADVHGASKVLPDVQRSRGRRPQDIILAEKDQPGSLEGQLLFQRASIWLTMATRHVEDGLPPKKKSKPTTTNGQSEKENGNPGPEKGPDGKRQTESRKTVKILARRALKDYVAFISQFEYSPDLPVAHVKDFNDRVNMAVKGVRNPRHSEATADVAPHTVYSLGDLFAATPPPGLAPYPSQDLVQGGSQPPPEDKSCEATTFHPLLSDALHSLLLAHVLAQTSPKEIQRHAYMVARLARLEDGYPALQTSRCPSRSDWTQVLAHGNNWIGLSANWETLCLPAPVPGYEASPDHHKSSSDHYAAADAAAALLHGQSSEAISEDRRKQSVRRQVMLDTLGDFEQAIDEETFRKAVGFGEEEVLDKEEDPDRKPDHGNITPPLSPETAMKRWASDEFRAHASMSARAAAITRWVLEAPVVTGTAKRKKKPRKEGPPISDVITGMDTLDVGIPAVEASS